jgi:DNA polymerase
MKRSVSAEDERVRGLLMFYGASKTGRWAGRLVQVQNLPQNKIADLELARDLVRSGEFDTLQMLYSSTPVILSQLIRTAFTATEGKKLIISDFSAIEARVIAWLAGEQWRLDVFGSHGKIYEASASAMFGVPIEKITKDSPLRAKGKVAELALGYQGSVGALKQMGGERMGLSEDEMKTIVSTWREANPKIVQLWSDLEEAALRAIDRGDKAKSIDTHGLRLIYRHGNLLIKLPSKRILVYPQARIAANKFGRSGIVYHGVHVGGYGEIETYGGKLTENVVQAIARDCLAEAMMRLDHIGYEIVMHIHDEVVIEGRAGALDEVNRILGEPIDWAPGLPLKGDGFETDFYKKD